MPGNSQGIVVSIQAKIEGWQNQIKAIQDALKNIKAGTGISKDLTKDLKQVETLVNNLGKNINQRLTSDSQITGFTDKLREVDEIFAHMGQRMTSISFADMDPNYITNNFKDLLDAIEQANNALSNGMTNSFQNAIAESTNLQKAFDKLDIDPSKMGAEELKKLLETKSNNLTNEIAKTNKEIDNLRSNAKATKQIMEEMQKAKILQVTDTKAESKTIVGDTSNLGTRQMDIAALQELETKINDVILKGGATLEQKLKDKHDQIDKAIKELVNVQSVEEARKKLQEIQDLFASVKAKGDFTRDIKIDKITDEQLTQWIPDPAAVQNKLNEIKSILAEYKIDPAVLNKINMEELIKQGNFDKLEDEIDKALRKTQNVAEKDIQKIKQTFDKLKDLADTKQRQVMSDSATKYNIDQGLSQWDGMIQKVQDENATLREEVEQLKAQLAERAIANVKALGGKTTVSGAQGIQDSTNAAKAYEAQLGRVKSAEQALGKLQGVVQRWFSIYAVIRMVRSAINSMINTIKELDKTITNIAIVTDMGQDDLWKQMPKYTQMARDYASSIAGVYEVSQLYYQQGLEMAEVMSLTEATLKMARISGLGYADATDYMTNAVRSFKMEMSEATTVVDVYSAVAASSATSVTELATAMSKTASSAEAVGSSFQNTTAMMAVMIEATRESPENIGSALKSIISRYGELKQNMTGTDAEGEDYSLNKVDTALQSIGISIHDVNGEFRDFDEVIMELAGKWDTVDKNTQRYIATVMAGNRQQSRFLALVSSGDRLRELADEAANSEDASQLQFLKSLDSIDSKVQQLQTSIQALYTNSGLEQAYKGILDFTNRIVTSFDNISNSQGLVGVVGKIATIFTTAAKLATSLFTTIKLKFSNMQAQMTADAALGNARRAAQDKLRAVQEETDIDKKKALWQEYQTYKTKVQQEEDNKRLTSELKASTKSKTIGMAAAAGGLITTTIASSLDVNENRELKAGLTGLGGVLSGVGTGMMIGGLPGVLMGIVTALPSVMESIGMWSESVEETIKKLETNITEANNQRIKSKDELKTLDDYKKKYDELNKSQYESNEAKQEFINLQNEIAEKYPELISRMDEEGNYTVNLTDGYKQLAAAKREAYKSDLINTMGAEIASLNNIDYVLKNVYGHTSLTNQKTLLGISTDNYEGLLDIDYSKTTDAINNLTSKIWNTEGINNQNYNIAKRLFNKNQNFDTVSGPLTFTYTDMGDELSKESSSVLNDIYIRFVEAMREGLDLNSAKAQVKQNFKSEYAQLIDNFDSNFYKELQLRYNIPSYQKDLVNNRLNAYTTEYINLIADSADAVFGTESGSLEKRFAKEQLSNEWNVQYDKLIERQNLGEDIDWSEEINNFYQSHEEFWYNIQLESEVLSGMDSAAREFYDSMGQHTLNEINELFKLKDVTNLEGAELEAAEQFNKLQEARRAFFNGIFTKDYQAIITNYNKWLESDSVTEFKIKDFSQLIGPDFLNGVQEKYDTILNSTVSSGTKQSQIDLLNQIYDAATSENISAKESNSILTALHGADLFSITGIYDAIEVLEKLQLSDNGKIITEALNNLSELISVNLTTEIGNLLNSYGSQIESFTKDLSNASKGLDFKSAAELADKLKLNLSDFNQIGDKFYLKDLTNLQDYYIQEDKKYQQALKDHIQQKKDLYEATTEIPVIETASEQFDLEAYITSEDEESRRLMYEYWEDEIKSISPTWTFENLEKYRANRSEYNRLNWVNEDQFKHLSKEYSFETGTKEFNLNEILKNNNYNLEAIENELTNEWTDILENANIDYSVLLSDIKSYIDNGDFSQTLAEYTANESYKLLDSVAEAEQQAVQYLIASTQLSTGDIQGFLNTTLGEVGKTEEEYLAELKKSAGGIEYQGMREAAHERAEAERNAIKEAIASGNISDLPEELQKYSKLVYDTYNKIGSTIFSTVTSALEKGTDAAIEVNELNVTKLIESGIVKSEDLYTKDGTLKSMVIIPYEDIKNMTDEEFNKFLQTTADTYEDRAKAIGTRLSQDRVNIKDSSEKVNDDLKNITYDEITTLWHDMGLLDKDNVSEDRINQLMKEWGLKYDAYGNIIGDITLIDKEIENLLQRYISGKISREDWIKELYKLNQLKEDVASSDDTAKGKALTDVIDNYTAVTSEQFTQLMTSFADLTLLQRIALENVFSINSNGTRTFDIAKFEQLVSNGVIGLSSLTAAMIEEPINKQIDNARTALTNATKLVTSGTTSEVEMQKWIDQIVQLEILEGAGREDVFNYDSLISAWTLKPEILYEYAQKQAQQYGLEGQEATQFIKDQTLKPLAEAVDLSSFIKATDQTEQATKTLRTQLEKWATEHYSGATPNPETLDAWIETIRTGGQAAIDLALQIATDAGKELSAEELQQYYAPLAQKYVGMAEQIANLVVGQYVGKGDFRTILEAAGIVDASTGLVKSVSNLAEAYNQVYQKLTDNTNATTAQLNSVYAQYLTAGEQGEIDAINALSNAMGMDYQSLGNLIAQYGKGAWSSLEFMMEHQLSAGIEQIGNGQIKITDWEKFSGTMNWEVGSEAYIKALESYNDSLISSMTETSESVTKEITTLAGAKAGQKINLTRVQAALDLSDEAFNKIFKQYGITINNGLLEIANGANIPAIVSAITKQVQDAANLIPDQMAQVKDAVVDALKAIANLIKNGINGSLTNVDALTLTNWAKEQGVSNLDFTQTATGLQLTADSLSNVYVALKSVDAVQAQALLPDIQSANASFSSFTSTLRALEGQEERNIRRNEAVQTSYTNLNEAINAATVKSTVTSDYNLRPHVVDEDGYTETYLSSSFSDEIGKTVLLTPILPDGSKLSDEGLQQIADSYLNGEIELETKIVGDDGKELDATLKDIFMGLYDTQDAAEDAANAYHEYHEAIMNAESSTDSFNDSLNNTTELMRDLVTSMLTDSDNFKFMDNELPEAMQSVVNTYESAYTAMDSLTTASTNGYIGLQDFYNIITTASTLMEAAGQEFSVKGKTAAQLMSEVGDSFVVVDGKLSVDLSSTGMDLVGNIGEIKDNLTSGIHSLAQAQIDMLDAEIAVLEIFAAMESLGEVDVDSDGISFEVEDIFDFSNASGWTTEFQEYLTKLQGVVDASEEATAAAKSIKINGISFYDLLSGSWEDWKKAGFTQETLSQFFQTVYNTDWTAFSGDLQAGIASVLNSLGIPVSVAIDGGMYHFSISQRTFDFKWDDEATTTAAKTALDKFYDENLSDGQVQKRVEEIYSDYSKGWQEDGTNTLEWDELWKAEVVCNVASSNFNIQKNKDGTYRGIYNNTTFKAGSEAEVQELIAKAMAYEDKGYTFEYDSKDNSVKGTKKIGSAQINIDYDKETEQITTSETGNTPYSSVDEAMEALLEQGFSNKDQEGYTFKGGRYEIKADASLGVNYTYDYADQKIIYKGNNFSSYDDFANYIAIVEPLKSKEEWKVNTKNSEYTIYTNGSAKIVQNMTTGELNYFADGIEFKSGEDYANYIAAKELSSNTDGTITIGSGGSTITYRIANKEVKLEVNERGIMTYSFNVGDVQFTADSDAGIKQALADYNFFSDDGGEITSTNSETTTYTVKKDGVTLNVEYSSDGVTVTSSDTSETGQDAASTVETQLNEKFQSSLNNVTPTATVSGLELTLGSGAKIDLSEDLKTGLELSEPIEKATVVLSSMELEPTLDSLNEVRDTLKSIDETDPHVALIVDEDESGIQKLESLGQQVEDLDNKTPEIEVEIDPGDEALDKILTLQNEVNTLDQMNPIVDAEINDQASGIIQSIELALNNLDGKSVTATVNIEQNGEVPTISTGSSGGHDFATGNIGLAKAQGTLMGELGPELVVSNGRYFVAGQNGAEFVDLASDAIVFNHLQTEQLLKNGMSSTRGKALTNERNATAYARGNSNGGIAMVNASAALAQLKALRSMWQSLLDSSVSDLAGTGGSGSGGGGSDDSSTSARNSYLADVERWYNWLQKIAVLEEKINTEEAKRSKYQADMVARGAEYAKSNLQTLKDLQSEAVTYQALANTQQEFFNLRRSQLNDSAFSRFYTFDENGQLKYNDNDLGYKFLAELMARDDYGEAKYSAEQQYNMLVGAGMEAYMKYDSSGTEILMDEESEDQSSFYSSSVQAFWDLVDSQKEEMQSLHDSIVEYGDSVIEKQTAAYEIMKEIEDNQIDVEGKVLAAIEDMRQREIDELQDQRDAIEEAANDLVNGLSDQLQKEQDMYTNQDSADELSKLQRQLGILQRSGGSASQIASLQREITQKQREAYFDAQQEQIDALKEASDNEIERLDRQIELMTESLEYEKENGLLWNAVYEVMSGTPEQITNFITQHDSEYWKKSPTEFTKEQREVLFAAEEFDTYRKQITGGIDKLISHFTDEAIQQGATEEAANSSGGGGSTGNGGGSSSGGSDDDDDDSGSSSSSSSSSSNSTGANTNNLGKNITNGISQGLSTTAILPTLDVEAIRKAGRENVIATTTGKSVNASSKTSTTVSSNSSIIKPVTITTINTGKISNAIKNLANKKASGGYVDHGIYELGEQGTETVLTAEQTKILRDNILSNRPNSLLSLLKSYNEGYDGIADSTTGITPVEDNSVIIEQAVVEMHVSKIANDYDAQRAGEQALEKMVQIARKTQGQNRVGR